MQVENYKKKEHKYTHLLGANGRSDVLVGLRVESRGKHHWSQFWCRRYLRDTYGLRVLNGETRTEN